MKRKAFLAIFLAAVFAAVLTGCQPAAPETNRSAAPVATPETVDTAAITTELMRIENDWPRVIREKDVAAARRVEADDVIIVYPDGNAGDKTQDLKDIESGAMTAESVEMADLKVNVIDKDAAVATGRVIIKNGKFKMPDGKTIEISGQYRFVDTFARRNGEWKLVAGASVPLRVPIAEASPAAGASPASKASPAAAPARPSPTARATATP
ncbi:MAG TPA: nuclear transport factor 2 family protein [Pyrinomonadaceae bacterium]|nr:nuclear transport factor 2 family protein [Pyrinomonadaceae bacterium]